MVDYRLTEIPQVYDTDGNILQAIDDHLVPQLLAKALTLVQSDSPVVITELGCGTGRNTAKLLLPLQTSSEQASHETYAVDIAQINALDLSMAMLEVAQKRCNAILSTKSRDEKTPDIQFREFDAIEPSSYPNVQSEVIGKAHLVLSTLVLEHLPLEVFFSTVKSLLIPGGDGLLVLTNMHPEMGDISQAGFLDEDTGEKIQGHSFSHRIEDVMAVAAKYGFSLVGELGERAVEESDVRDDGGNVQDRLLGKRGRKWIGIRVWFGGVFRLQRGSSYV